MVDNELSGNWVGFHADMRKIGAEYLPISMLDLGSGFFVGLDAMAQAGSLRRYLGVDIRPYDQSSIEFERNKYPAVKIDVIHADLGTFVPNVEHFDLVSIDAHGAPSKAWQATLPLEREIPDEDSSYEDQMKEWDVITEAQCKIAHLYTPKVIVVDDTCVPCVREIASRYFGEPTGVGEEGAQTLWWWKR